MSGTPRRVLGVLVEATGDEWVAYVRSRDTAHAMNRTAGALFDHIDGQRDIVELASAVGVDVDVARLGVQELAEAGLITYDTADSDSVSRRGLLKKIGVGSAAAAALPIVETIVAPTRAAASSLPGETEVPTPFPTEAVTPIPTAPPLETMAPTPAPTDPPTRRCNSAEPTGRLVNERIATPVETLFDLVDRDGNPIGVFESNPGGVFLGRTREDPRLRGFTNGNVTTFQDRNGDTVGFLNRTSLEVFVIPEALDRAVPVSVPFDENGDFGVGSYDIAAGLINFGGPQSFDVVDGPGGLHLVLFSDCTLFGFVTFAESAGGTIVVAD